MNRTTIIALIVFVGLAAGVLITRNQAPERGIERISFSFIDPDRVDTIRITGANPAVLERSDDGERWTVTDIGKDADGTMVDRVLTQLNQLESSDLVTRSEERFEELGVAGDERLEVELLDDGKALATLTVGDDAAGGSYVLVDGQVFAAKGIYQSAFGREVDQWLDRRLFRGRSLDSVTKIEAKLSDDQGFTLVNTEGSWSFSDDFDPPEGFRFDANAARTLASTLVNLRAQEIVLEEAEATGLDEGAVGYTLHFDKDDTGPAGTVEVRIGDALQAESDDDDEEEASATLVSDEVYAQVDSRPDELVTILASQARRLREGIDQVRDLELMAFEADDAVKLQILSDGGRLEFIQVGEDGEDGEDVTGAKGIVTIGRDGKDGGTTWEIAETSEKQPEDFEFDPSAVDRRIRAIADARATGLNSETSPASAGLTTSRSVVRVTLSSGESVELKFGREIDNGEGDSTTRLFASGNADDRVYEVTEWLKTSLTGGLDGFKVQPPPPPGSMGGFDPNTLKNLPPELRKSLEKQMAQQQQ